VNDSEIIKLVSSFDRQLTDKFNKLETECYQPVIDYANQVGVRHSVAMDLAHLGDSAAQRFRCKGGNRFEQEFRQLLTDAGISSELHQEVGRKKTKTIDIAVALSRTLFHFSLKKSPAERAKDTWPEECRRAKRAADQTHRICRFVALTHKSLQSSLRADLPPSVEYGSTKDPNFLTRIIQDMLDEIKEVTV
jgi:hypothetical protein